MSKEELIARGHAILDEAPRDYSAITNLVVDVLAEGWGEGYEAAEGDMYTSTNEAYLSYDTPNPYRKEEN